MGSSFSGPGVTEQHVQNPAGLTPGVQTITYTYPGPSGPLSTTFQITVPQEVPTLPAWAWAVLSIGLYLVASHALRQPRAGR